MTKKRIIVFSAIIVFVAIAIVVVALLNRPKTPDKTVDIDVSAMSVTMAFSQMSNIYASPDDYAGKTIKVAGKFEVYNGYDYIVVSDSTACCDVGIQLMPSAGYVFDGTLLNNQYVTVSGSLCVADSTTNNRIAYISVTGIA